MLSTASGFFQFYGLIFGLAAAIVFPKMLTLRWGIKWAFKEDFKWGKAAKLAFCLLPLEMVVLFMGRAMGQAFGHVGAFRIAAVVGDLVLTGLIIAVFMKEDVGDSLLAALASEFLSVVLYLVIWGCVTVALIAFT